MITTLCRRVGVLHVDDDNQLQCKQGTTHAKIPSLMVLVEDATTSIPPCGARTIVVAIIATLKNMVEQNRAQISEIETKLVTFFKYVHDIDMVINMNFLKLLLDEALIFPTFLE
ncbi:hypothetical protein GQ457_10G013960 [Hibiscus cannabinus]